jgi:hypothetical protein
VLERRSVRSFAQMQKCGRLLHVRSNALQVRSTAELHCVSVRALGSHAGARLVYAGARTCWNRRQCVRPQVLRSTALSTPDFLGTRTESYNQLKTN